MPWVRRLSGLVVILGLVAGVVGVGYAINGMTQAPGFVKAPVTLIDADAPTGWADVEVDVPGVDVPDGWFAGAQPPGSGSGLVSGADGRLTIVAWDSTRIEQLLSRGDRLVGGLGLLVGALALGPVLGSIAQGRPFAPGNARRLTVVAATVAIAGSIAPTLPEIAGFLVLERTGLAGPDFASATSPSLQPVLVGGVVLALALAFRAGERLSDDVRGLV